MLRPRWILPLAACSLLTLGLAGCGDDEALDGGEETSSANSGDGDGDGDSTSNSGDGDGDGDSTSNSGDGDGDGDSTSNSGDGDATGDGDGDATGDGDGDGDSTGDGDGDLPPELTVSVSELLVSADFMPAVPPDPWNVTFIVTVDNLGGDALLNVLDVSLTFGDALQTTVEVSRDVLPATTGTTMHMLMKISLDPVPDVSYCDGPVILDKIQLEVEGTGEILSAASEPGVAPCVF